MTKASEILKKECCGHLYNAIDGKSDLVKMVEKLERDNEIMNTALIDIQTLPSARMDESSQVAFIARKACKYG